MASLSLQHINKTYPNGFQAVKDFNLEIEDKEFIIFVGPSGCGKSTTLRMIAGLEEISDGTLKIDDKVVNDVEPKAVSYTHLYLYDQGMSLETQKTKAGTYLYEYAAANLKKVSIRDLYKMCIRDRPWSAPRRRYSCTSFPASFNAW